MSFIYLLVPLSLSFCPPGLTSPLSGWMEDRLTWESNEARDTSTTYCLVTADAPLNPSTTSQRYYIINSVNRVWPGGCKCNIVFIWRSQRSNEKAIYCTVRTDSAWQMTRIQSIIFCYLSIPKRVRPPINTKTVEQSCGRLLISVYG